MQVIRRKSDHVALYLFKDSATITLGPHMTEPVRAFDINATDHEVVPASSGPSWWLGGAYSFDNDTWTVVDQVALDSAIDRDLQAAKAARRAAVNALRGQKLISDFTFNSVVYQADDLSQKRINRARTSALAAILSGAQSGDYRWHGENVDFFWIAKDNTHVVMDAQTALDFGNAMVAREGMLIAAGSAIKAAIEAAADHAALDAIDITAGWPA